MNGVHLEVLAVVSDAVDLLRIGEDAGLPVSLRGVLVAVAGLTALALGVHRRLAAPFVLGALTTGLLALRHLEPYAEAVPRWVVLAGAGVVLLGVGVTWESRRRDLDRAGRYLVGLR